MVPLMAAARETVLFRAGAPLPPAWTFTCTSTKLVRDGSDGLQLLAANTPALVGPDGQLLVQGARTQALRNPRQEGAVVGGALPTNASLLVSGGLALSVVALLTEGNMVGVRYRLAGTASGTEFALVFETTQGVAAANGQTWAHGLTMRTVAGGAPDSWALRAFGRASDGSAAEALAAFAIAPIATTRRRFSAAQTFTQAAVAYVTSGVGGAITNGGAYDFQFDVFFPAMEQAAFLSSPAAPASGMGATTRALDNLLRTDGAALFPTGAGTLLLALTFDGIDVAGSQYLFYADDGTGNERVFVRKFPATDTIRASVTRGGTTTASTSAGSVVAGVEVKLGLAWDAAGCSLTLGSGGGVTIAGASGPASLQRVYLGGTNAIALSQSFAAYRRASTWPIRLDTAAITARLSSF